MSDVFRRVRAEIDRRLGRAPRDDAEFALILGKVLADHPDLEGPFLMVLAHSNPMIAHGAPGSRSKYSVPLAKIAGAP